MPASALLKFTQGATIGGNGQALVGVLTTPVTLANVNNTGVASWQIDLVYADSASAVVPATPYAFNDSSSLPTASFIPDVRRSWRWVLKVWSVPNRVGEPDSIDIRWFTVREANGVIVPPSQVWPLPLPDPRSGDVSAKPNEANFGGQQDGWAGTGSDGLLNSLLVRIPPTLGAPGTVLSSVGGEQAWLPSVGGPASVRVAITAHVADLANVSVTQDGVTLLEGDAVLLAETPAHAQNGPYVLGAVSGGSAPLTRRSDFDASAEAVPGSNITVREGTSGSGVWFLQTGLPITLGVTPLLFVKSSSGAVSAADTTVLVSGGAIRRNAMSGVVAAALGSNVNAFTSGAVDASLALNAAGALKDNSRINLADQPWGATTRQGLTTVTTTAGSAVVTLTSGVGDWVNGDSVTIPGAGGNPALATPAAPTVQQFGTAGSRTRSYKVIMMTLEGGYSDPSPATTITDAPTALGAAAGVKVFVPRDTTSGAAWAIVYEQLDGTGNYLIKAVTALYQHLDQSSETFVPVAHLLSDAAVNSRYGLPAIRISTGSDKICPTSGAPNWHRARILSGAGTTSVTLDLACASAITGAQMGHCNWLPYRDAIVALGGFTSQVGAEIFLPKGGYRFAKNIHIDHPIWLHGSRGGSSQNAATQINFVDGFGFQFDDARTGEKWCPKAYYRLGDRVNTLLPGAGVTRAFECTTAGYAGTAEPTWNQTDGATTTDGSVVWTARSTASTGQSCEVSGLTVNWDTPNFPPNPHFAAWRNFNSYNPDLANNQNWAASTAVSLNAYRRPTVPNGFVYKCTTAGTTAGSEPNWAAAGKLKLNATITDNTVVWTAVDCRQHQGAAFMVYTRATIEDVSVDTCRGWAVALRGGAQEGTNCNNSVVRRVVVTNGYGGGIVAEGQDSNTCSIENCSLTSNDGPGYADHSFLGCTWFKNHSQTTGASGAASEVPAFAYANTYGGTQSGSAFIACYEESGQVHEFLWPALVIGGTMAGDPGAKHEQGTLLTSRKRFALTQIENFGTSTVDYLTNADGVLYSWEAGANTGVKRLTGDGLCSLSSLWSGSARWLHYNGSNQTTGRVWQEIVQGVYGRGLAMQRILLGDTSIERKLTMRQSAFDNFWAKPGDVIFDAGDGVAFVPRLGWTANAPTGTSTGVWAASTSFVTGDVIVANSRVYAARNSGTTAAGASPTSGWTTTTGNTAVDGTITWECRGTSTNNLQSIAHPSPPAGTNLTDADATITWAQGAWRKLPTSTLTQNRTITLSVSGLSQADAGIQIRVERFDLSEWRLAITNAGGAGGTTYMRGGRPTVAVFQFDGTDWILLSFGELSNAPALRPGAALTDADTTRVVADGACHVLAEGTLTTARNFTASPTGALSNKQRMTWIIQKQGFNAVIKDGAGTTLYTVPAGSAQSVTTITSSSQFVLDAVEDITA